MSKVDWSLAPDDATHFGQGEDCGYWAKSIGNQQYFINIARWDNGKWKEVSERYDEKFLIARPKQPQPWSGPEDGLPPVNTICEFRFRNSGSTTPWLEAEVRYLSDVTVVMRLDQHFDGHTEICRHPATVEFRRLKTAEQQAADKRESAIRELMDIAQVDCRVTAARLVDAGFKREACRSDCSTNNRGVPELLGACDCR